MILDLLFLIADISAVHICTLYLLRIVVEVWTWHLWWKYCEPPHFINLNIYFHIVMWPMCRIDRKDLTLTLMVKNKLMPSSCPLQVLYDPTKPSPLLVWKYKQWTFNISMSMITLSSTTPKFEYISSVHFTVKINLRSLENCKDLLQFWQDSPDGHVICVCWCYE